MSLESDYQSALQSIRDHQYRGNKVEAERMQRIAASIQKQIEGSRATSANSVDRAIDLVKGDAALDRATADAQAFLLDRYDSFTGLGLPKGLASKFEDLDDLPNSKEWPEAYSARFGDKPYSLRIGTEYQDNGVTGTRMAVPSVDPTDSTKPLTMFEGTRRDAQAVQRSGQQYADDMLSVPKASEYVQRQILRRAGKKAEMNTNINEKDTDFIVEGRKVDGQTHRQSWGDPKVQAYTWVDPSGPPRGDRMDQANEVVNIIKSEIDATPNDDLRTIVDDIGKPGPNQKLRGPHNNAEPFRGKLYDQRRAPKDEVFGTVYEDQFHQSNSRTDTTAKAPSDLFIDDVKEAQKTMEGLSGDDLKASIKAFPNATQGGMHKPRTQLHIAPPPSVASRFRQTGEEILKQYPQVGQFLDAGGKLMRNPAVRLAGTALAAVPVLGDAADATTGTVDVVTKTGDQQVRGAGNAVAGITGLATLAAPAAAPILVPVSSGLGIGNALADNAKERKQARSIGESSKYERSGAFSHTAESPVSIGLPGTVQSETQRRRQARRSSSGKTPVTRPQTGKQWWEKGVDSLMNYFN